MAASHGAGAMGVAMVLTAFSLILHKASLMLVPVIILVTRYVARCSAGARWSPGHPVPFHIPSFILGPSYVISELKWYRQNCCE
jgi:hypothetical protein